MWVRVLAPKSITVQRRAVPCLSTVVAFPLKSTMPTANPYNEPLLGCDCVARRSEAEHSDHLQGSYLSLFTEILCIRGKPSCTTWLKEIV